MAAEYFRLDSRGEEGRGDVAGGGGWWGWGEEGGINKLNDTKEQCCDSEHLASSPCVDRPGCMRVAGALDKDRLSCDCSSRCRASHTGVIDGVCGGTKLENMTNGTQPNVPLYFLPSRYFPPLG